MRILWIEDFSKEDNVEPSKLASNLFRDLLKLESFDEDYNKDEDVEKELPKYFRSKGSIHDVVICKSYHSFMESHKSNLYKYDIYIIDINLTTKEPKDSKIPEGFIRETFLEKAGFYIWNLLIRQGGHEEQIAFITANEDNTKKNIKDFETHCIEACIPKLKIDNIFGKNETDYSRFRKDWLELKESNTYIQLRRGILDACEVFQNEGNLPEIFLNKALKENEDHLQKEYGLEYLKLLKNFFLKEFAIDEANKKFKLRSFLLLLSAEWERAFIETRKPISSYDGMPEKNFHSVNLWIMKNLRNNLTHFSFTDDNSEVDVAFFFMLAMRNFFDLEVKEYPFEKVLFGLSFNNKNNKDLSDLKKINNENKEKLLEVCKNKKVKMKKIKEEKPEICDNCNQKIKKKEKTFDWHDFQISDSYLEIAYAFMEIQNNNRDKNPKTVKKEDLKKHTKTFLYHAFLSEMESYLIKMETIIGEANFKDKLFYKLGAFALEAVSKQKSFP